MKLSNGMNKRITIQEKTVITNEEGYQVEDWAEVATMWASIKHLHGSEFFKAQAVNSKATMKCTIRHRKGLTSDMRILYDGVAYNITYLDDINEQHEYIEMMCEVIA